MLTSPRFSLFRLLRYAHALFRWLVILLVLGIVINAQVVTVFRVSGVSMEPTYQDGNYLLVCKVCATLMPLKEKQVVVVEYEADRSLRLVKRLVGLPNTRIAVEGRAYELRAGEYFVLGDNAGQSVDSRDYGPIKKTDVIGVVLLRAGR
jgi:signal peptidase I